MASGMAANIKNGVPIQFTITDSQTDKQTDRQTDRL